MKTKRLKPYKFMCLIMALVMICGLVEVAAPKTAFASSTIDTSKTYRLRNKHSGKHMGLRWESLNTGTKFEQQGWYNDTQLFRLVPDGSRGYKLYNIKSSLYVDVWGGNRKKDEIVISYYNNGGANQRFDFQSQSDGSYKIRAKHSGYYLTIKSDRTGHGALVVQWPYKSSGVENQNWYLEEVKPRESLHTFFLNRIKNGESGGLLTNDANLVDLAYASGYPGTKQEMREMLEEIRYQINPKADRVYKIKSKRSGYYLDIEGTSHQNRAKVILRKSRTMASQFFKILQTGDAGYYFNIINDLSSKVLSVEESSHDNSRQIIQYENLDDDNQAYEFIKVKEDYLNSLYKIKVKHSGKYLTVKDDSPYEYAQLVQHGDKGLNDESQLWYLEEIDTRDTLASFVKTQIEQYYDMDISSLGAKSVSAGLEFGQSNIEEAVDKHINDKVNRPGTEVYDVKGNFITTYDMLNKRIDEITFMGAHNAFANNWDRRSSKDWDTYKDDHEYGSENQKQSIWNQLDNGYRIIDLDIGDNGNGKTGSYHRYRLRGYTNLTGNNGILPKMKNWLQNNPSQILIINISEVYKGQLELNKLSSDSLYSYGSDKYYEQMTNLMEDMKNEGILEDVWNYNGNQYSQKSDHRQNLLKLTDGNWPTLKEVLKSGKRIFLLQRDAGYGHKVNINTQADPNRVLPSNLQLSDEDIDNMKSGKKLERKMLNFEIFEDWGASAGDIDAAYINNNGERLYNLFHEANQRIKEGGANKNITFALLDYVCVTTHPNERPDSIEHTAIDAANRLNYENFGYDWNANNVPNDLYWD